MRDFILKIWVYQKKDEERIRVRTDCADSDFIGWNEQEMFEPGTKVLRTMIISKEHFKTEPSHALVMFQMLIGQLVTLEGIIDDLPSQFLDVILELFLNTPNADQPTII